MSGNLLVTVCYFIFIVAEFVGTSFDLVSVGILQEKMLFFENKFNY